MKTAIIKTTFWDEDAFSELHIDTKLVYFYLLANPTRTLHKITKLNTKICSVHTGLNLEHVEKGLKQLEQNNLIKISGKYYVLLKDFVEAKKGRYTDQVIQREEKEIPEEVINELKKYTGNVPVYKYKDNDKDIDIDNDISESIESFSLDKRKQKFKTELKTYVSQYGREMLNEFFLYWTELNKSQTKMKFELEKTWETSKRLITWHKRSQQFKPKNEPTYRKNPIML